MAGLAALVRFGDEPQWLGLEWADGSAPSVYMSTSRDALLATLLDAAQVLTCAGLTHTVRTSARTWASQASRRAAAMTRDAPSMLRGHRCPPQAASRRMITRDWQQPPNEQVAAHADGGRPADRSAATADVAWRCRPVRRRAVRNHGPHRHGRRDRAHGSVSAQRSGEGGSSYYPATPGLIPRGTWKGARRRRAVTRGRERPRQRQQECVDRRAATAACAPSGARGFCVLYNTVGVWAARQGTWCMQSCIVSLVCGLWRAMMATASTSQLTLHFVHCRDTRRAAARQWGRRRRRSPAARCQR